MADGKLNILWFTWKDGMNPSSGGAEIVNEALARRLTEAGHCVRFVVPRVKGASDNDEGRGFEMVRVGNRLSVYAAARRYYKRHGDRWADVVVDECNTIPFLCKYYARKKTVLLLHQLGREIWLYEKPFSLGLLGYTLEYLYLRLLRDQTTFTFAESTKKDLQRYGFHGDRVVVLKEPLTMPVIETAEPAEKFEYPSILYLSAIRKMKRPHHVVEAFEIAKQRIPELRLNIAGGGRGRYFNRLMRRISNSPYRDDIHYWGWVTPEQKMMLLQRSHFICCASVREGWGLVVTEAAARGTPAIVYNVLGLIDAVDNGAAGTVTTRNDPQGLADKIIEGFGPNTDYQALRQRAIAFAGTCSIDAAVASFLESIDQLTTV